MANEQISGRAPSEELEEKQSALLNQLGPGGLSSFSPTNLLVRSLACLLACSLAVSSLITVQFIHPHSMGASNKVERTKDVQGHGYTMTCENSCPASPLRNLLVCTSMVCTTQDIPSIQPALL